MIEAAYPSTQVHQDYSVTKLPAVLKVPPFAKVNLMSQLGTLLLGSWRMISWTYEVLETGEVKDAKGKNPCGVINYGPDGRMTCFVFDAERVAPKALVPTAEEKIDLYDTMFAYAGTYTVENDRVIHHLDMSWNKTWEGTQQVRFVETDGRRLTLKSAPAKNPFDGRDCIHSARWEKIASLQR